MLTITVADHSRSVISRVNDRWIANSYFSPWKKWEVNSNSLQHEVDEAAEFVRCFAMVIDKVQELEKTQEPRLLEQRCVLPLPPEDSD